MGRRRSAATGPVPPIRFSGASTVGDFIVRKMGSGSHRVERRVVRVLGTLARSKWITAADDRHMA